MTEEQPSVGPQVSNTTARQTQRELTAAAPHCQWPGGCDRELPRPGTAGGQPRKYCGQPGDDGEVHERTNAFNWNRKQKAQAGGTTLTDVELKTPVSMARASSVTMTEQLTQLVAQIQDTAAKVYETVALTGDATANTIEIETIRSNARQQVETAQNAVDAATKQAGEADQARQLAYDAHDQLKEEKDAADRQVRELTGQLADRTSEHAEQLRAMAQKQQAEHDRIEHDAEQRVAAKEAEAEELVRQARETADGLVAEAQTEADQRVTAAEETRDQGIAHAEDADRERNQALLDTAAAKALAEQAAAQTEHVRDGYERQIAGLREDAARDREQSAAELGRVLEEAAARLAEVQQGHDRERLLLKGQVTAATDQAARLTAELERDRQAAGERLQELRAAHKAEVQALTTTAEVARQAAASAEIRAGRAESELERLRAGTARETQDES